MKNFVKQVKVYNFCNDILNKMMTFIWKKLFKKNSNSSPQWPVGRGIDHRESFILTAFSLCLGRW